jgi:hypothetical protein
VDINHPLVIKAAPINLTNQATRPIKVGLTKQEQAAPLAKQPQGQQAQLAQQANTAQLIDIKRNEIR